MQIVGRWKRVSENYLAKCGPFAFLELSLADTVVTLENEKYKLIYEGIIFDASNESLLKDPTLLDSAFGYYTYLLFDKNARSVFLGADRAGYSPVYFAAEEEWFRFSSSLTLLKYELPRVTANLDAWDEQLTLNDILGEKTVVKEIRRLRWGRKFRMTAARVDTVDFWEPEFPAFTDKKTYIRRNNELLCEAMRLTASCDRRRIVLLSGGEDSRRLAITARHVGFPFTCVTQEAVGKDACDKDVLIAESVGRALGVPHIRVPRSSERDIYNDAIAEDYWLGYEAGQHEWILPLLRRLPERSLVYDGIVADVTVNGHFFRAYPQLVTRFDDLDYAAQLLCGARHSGIEPKLLSSPLFERVRAELARYPESPHRLTYYFLLNHTRRCIGSWFKLLNLFGHLPAPPYLFHSFLIHSLSIEPHHYLEGWMQSECMKEIDPVTAAIPSTRNKVPSHFVIDLKSEARLRSKFAARHLRIRRDAPQYLPGLARTRRTFEAISFLGLRNGAEKWSWAPRYLTRFSRYLDWLEDRQAPAFPVRSETTPFLARHVVK